MPYESMFDYVLKNKIQDQQRNKELMQQQLFQSNQADAARQWSKNNMTAYETGDLAQKEADRQQRRSDTYNELKAKGFLQKVDPSTGEDIDNNTTPQQQSPASKVIQQPFDFMSAGQAQTSPSDTMSTPGASGGNSGAQGALQPTSISGGSPSGSSPTPSGDGPTASAFDMLLPARTSGVAQSQQGSVNPSDTAQGQSGHDSGTLPAPQGMAGGIGNSFKPDYQDQTGAYRWTTPDERDAKTNSIAVQQAAAAHALKQTQLKAFLQTPEGQSLSDFSKRGLMAEVMTGQKLPEETAQQMEAELMGKAQQAVKDKDPIAYQQYSQLLGAHLTHGQNAPPAQLWKHSNGTTFSMTPGMTIQSGDEPLKNDETKQPTPQIGYVPIKDTNGNTTGYNTQVIRGGESNLPGNMQSQAGVNTANTPTSSMRTRGEMSQSVIDQIPRINQEIDALGSKLGPAVGRWNDLMIGKGGLNDPEFKGLNMDLQLLSSGLRVAHFGMRSGGEAYQKQLQQDFSAAQTPEDLKAVINSAQNFMGSYAKFAKHPDFSPNEATTGPIQPKTVTNQSPMTNPPPTPKPIVKGQKLDIKNRDTYLQLFGGDKVRSAQAATNDGWDISK